MAVRMRYVCSSQELQGAERIEYPGFQRLQPGGTQVSVWVCRGGGGAKMGYYYARMNVIVFRPWKSTHACFPTHAGLDR